MHGIYNRWRYGNEGWKQTFRQCIADYQKVAASWQFKETIKERREAFKEEQELEQRARIAERFLRPQVTLHPPSN